MTTTQNADWVIAGIYAEETGVTVPRLWNFYPSEDAAKNALRENGAHIQGVYGEQCACIVTTYDDFVTRKRSAILTGQITEISDDEFYEARDCLPPNWTTGHDLSGFLMSEHFSGPYTTHYAELDCRFFSKMIDSTDRSTWMSEAELRELMAAECKASPGL